MNIGEILKELQPCEYISLDKERRKSKRNTKKISLRKGKENLNVKELMFNRYYRRGRGGAIKQVR